VGWHNACDQRWAANGIEINSMCGNLCHGAVELMYSVLRYDDGVFCPSCIAFEKSQNDARDGTAN